MARRAALADGAAVSTVEALREVSEKGWEEEQVLAARGHCVDQLDTDTSKLS